MTLTFIKNYICTFFILLKNIPKLTLIGKLQKPNGVFFQTNKIGNVGIIGKLVVPYICSFLLYLQHVILVRVELDASGC